MTPHSPRAPERRACALAVLAAAVSGNVSAAGFALIEHGASGLGNAYAGAAAVSADGSTVWFNAAGITELPDSEISLAAHVLSTTTDFTNEGTTLAASLGGAEVSGDDATSAGTTSILPNLYYNSRLNDQWFYGLSIGVPYGSSSEYDRDWVGRYTTVQSGINVIDVNPSMAYKLSDTVRLGFGVSFQVLDAELGSAVDSGAVCLAVYGSEQVNMPEQCFEAGLTPGNVERDGYGNVTGDSTGVGFNLGALFLPGPNTKIGVAYRSGVDHTLDGDGDFTTDEALRELLDNVGSTLLTDSGAATDVSLPATLSLSAAQRVGERAELLADITWTGWSSVQEIRITYDNQQQPDTVSRLAYNDVLRFSAGVNFDLNTKVQLRGGLAYDQEAIDGPGTRTARLPGNDRTWIAFGLGYRASDRLSFDLGYTHLFLPDTAIDNQNLESAGGSIVRGNYDSSVDIFSAQLNWAFN